MTVETKKKLLSFAEYLNYNDGTDNHYELVLGKLEIMNPPTVSPESITRDYRYKRSEYAALEVPEYWIVDPQANKVTVLILNEGLYEETSFTATEKIISLTFTELDLTAVNVLSVK